MTFDEQVVARTVKAEAGNQPREGKIAVAWVIRNRMTDAKHRWPTTGASVCLQAFQFSCWNTDSPVRRNITRWTEDEMREYYEIVAAVFGGIEPDPTKGSCHYEVVGTPVAWDAGRSPVVTIDKHEFYNDVP